MSLSLHQTDKKESLYMQVYHHYRELIMERRLPARSRMPSLRKCAEELNLSRYSPNPEMPPCQRSGTISPLPALTVKVFVLICGSGISKVHCARTTDFSPTESRRGKRIYDRFSLTMSDSTAMWSVRQRIL